ncbi:2-hydroxy-3-oxopropionate reductase [bacterium HR31]|nr:2-hydroxy-3-oxopropionate reductase [bacterium HR31]
MKQTLKGGTQMQRVGFIGLGAMGAVIVPRLLEAGCSVVGWNRTEAKARPLVEAGMRWARSPRAVAEQSEVVFSIVTDGRAVREVALGPDGVLQGLPPGGVYVDMSTIDPDVSRSVAEEFRKAGRFMLDAPISGAPPTVREGKASLMVGGDLEVYERVRTVLLAIGPKVMYVGPNGMACAMKLAVNLLLMVEVIAFGEAVALAEKCGVDRPVAVEAILNSVAASPVLAYRGPFILEGRMPETPLADVNLQQKDMLLVLDLARRLGSPVPLAAAANEMMNACRGLQLDHLDFVAAHRVYRKLGGAG